MEQPLREVLNCPRSELTESMHELLHHLGPDMAQNLCELLPRQRTVTQHLCQLLHHLRSKFAHPFHEPLHLIKPALAKLLCELHHPLSAAILHMCEQLHLGGQKRINTRSGSCE